MNRRKRPPRSRLPAGLHDSVCHVERYFTACTDPRWTWTLFLQATGLATLSWPTSSLGHILRKVTP